MEKTIQMLEVILPVIAMLCLGVVTRKCRIISDRAVIDIKSLLVNICIPAVLFKTFYSTVFTWRMVVFLLMMTAMTAASYFIGILFTRMMRIRQDMAPYLCATIAGPMVGFALFSMLFGENEIYRVALLDLGSALILLPFLTTRLRLRAQTEVTPKIIAKTLVTPVNIAMFGGIAVSVSGLGAVISGSNAGPVLDEILSFINKPASALILVVIGYGLVFRDVRWKEILQTIAARVVIFAIFGAIAFRITAVLFPDDLLYRYAVVLSFALPPSYLYSAYIKSDKDEATYVGTVLAFYTIVTVIGYIIVAWMSM